MSRQTRLPHHHSTHWRSCPFWPQLLQGWPLAQSTPGPRPCRSWARTSCFCAKSAYRGLASSAQMPMVQGSLQGWLRLWWIRISLPPFPPQSPVPGLSSKVLTPSKHPTPHLHLRVGFRRSQALALARDHQAAKWWPHSIPAVWCPTSTPIHCLQELKQIQSAPTAVVGTVISTIWHHVFNFFYNSCTEIEFTCIKFTLFKYTYNSEVLV